MSDSELAKIRSISKTGVSTPLVVPSYSSRGFNPVRVHFDLYSRYTTSCCLVSAYDIYYNLLPESVLYSSDAVILDSGGYEAYASSELSTPAKWTIAYYVSVLEKVNERSNVIPVTFDFGNQRPLQEQLDSAEKLTEQFGDLSWDLLIKPSTPTSQVIDIEEFLSLIPSLLDVAMVGFVESELGSSIIERARNIRRIREKFNECKRDIPIHLFGCLDLNLIPYYVFAGADVFDGLQWLRQVLTNDGAVRFSSMIVHEKQWSVEDNLLISSYRVRNIQSLSDLHRELIECLNNGGSSFSSLKTVSEHRALRFFFYDTYPPKS